MQRHCSALKRLSSTAAEADEGAGGLAAAKAHGAEPASTASARPPRNTPNHPLTRGRRMFILQGSGFELVVCYVTKPELPGPIVPDCVSGKRGPRPVLR